MFAMVVCGRLARANMRTRCETRGKRHDRYGVGVGTEGHRRNRRGFKNKRLTPPPLTAMTVLDASLGLESLDFAEMVVRLEQAFGKTHSRRVTRRKSARWATLPPSTNDIADMLADLILQNRPADTREAIVSASGRRDVG